MNKSVSVEKKSFSRAEFAHIHNISISTVDNLIATNELVPTRIGRRVLISEAEAERFSRRKYHRTKRADNRTTADMAQVLNEQ